MSSSSGYRTLNTDRLDGLLADLGGDTAVATELIGIYLKNMPERITMLKEALSSDDREQIRLHAHSLKSTSATFGAEYLSSIGAQLEQWADRLLEVDAGVLMAEALSQQQLVVAAIDSYLEQLSSG